LILVGVTREPPKACSTASDASRYMAEPAAVLVSAGSAALRSLSSPSPHEASATTKELSAQRIMPEHA
jgi:hypothetical protein